MRTARLSKLIVMACVVAVLAAAPASAHHTTAYNCEHYDWIEVPYSRKFDYYYHFIVSGKNYHKVMHQIWDLVGPSTWGWADDHLVNYTCPAH